MATNMFLRIVLLITLCVMYSTAAAAQAVYGSLVGNVTDSSGGAIPGAASGTLVTVESNENVLNAPGTTTQFADKVKDGPVEIFGDAGPSAQYFDVSAYRSVTEVRFGNSGQGEWRDPSAPNVDMSLFRVFRFGQNRTLQVRAEVFNVSNTPHFSNPNADISNVTFNPDGSIRAVN